MLINYINGSFFIMGTRIAPGNGWWGYKPPSKHASPPSEGVKLFFRSFLKLKYPVKGTLAPSSEASAPIRKIPGAPCKGIAMKWDFCYDVS